MKSKILFVCSLLFGLLFLNGGLNKLFHYMPMPTNLPPEMLKDMGAFMEIAWLMPLVACAEILSGVLIIIPKTRALAALIIFPVMVGVLLVTLFTNPSGIVMVLILWAILLWVMYENKHKYAALL